MAQSTRKELRQPDQFISFSRRAGEYLQKHLVPVIAAGAAVFLVVVVSIVWNHFAMAHRGEATGALAEALEAYSKPLIVPTTDGGVDPEEGFATPADRCRDVLAALDRLDDEYGGSDPTHAGALVRAGCLLDSGKTAEAIKAYRAYLSAASSRDPYRFLAYEGLGYALEREGKLSDALNEFQRMAPEGSPMRDRAMWHEARLLEAQGKTKEALALYKQILDKYPGTVLRDEIVTRSGALGE